MVVLSLRTLYKILCTNFIVKSGHTYDEIYHYNIVPKGRQRARNFTYAMGTVIVFHQLISLMFTFKLYKSKTSRHMNNTSYFQCQANSDTRLQNNNSFKFFAIKIVRYPAAKLVGTLIM